MKINIDKIPKGFIVVSALIFIALDVWMFYFLGLKFAIAFIAYISCIGLATSLVYFIFLFVSAKIKSRKIIFQETKRLFHFSFTFAFFLCNIVLSSLVIFFSFVYGWGG